MEQETKKAWWPAMVFVVAVAGLFTAGLLLVWHFGPSAPGQGRGDGGKEMSGYGLNLPADWYVEKDRGTSVAVYPDASDASNASSSPGCKIELSVFPAAGSGGDADWIAKHLAEDPTLDVEENSSDALTVSGDPAVRWNGTIDGASTTLIYIFAPGDVYEVAPSSLSETPITLACAPYLDIFLDDITL